MAETLRNGWRRNFGSPGPFDVQLGIQSFTYEAQRACGRKVQAYTRGRQAPRCWVPAALEEGLPLREREELQSNLSTIGHGRSGNNYGAGSQCLPSASDSASDVNSSRSSKDSDVSRLV